METVVKVHRNTHYQLDDISKDAFLSWWNKTEYGKEKDKHNFSWEAKNRSSRAWDHFIECAQIATGEPAVLCKACDKKYVYPCHHQNVLEMIGQKELGWIACLPN
jgi:hypothetical protein